MRVLIVVALLVGVALAEYQTLSHKHCCTAGDAKKVQKFWNRAWSSENSHQRTTFAKAIFTDLFDHHPEAKALFKRVNVDDMDSPEFKAHGIRVMGGLDRAINLLNHRDALHADLAHMQEQHHKRDGVKAAHFIAIGETLERVLPRAIPEFNSDAWWKCSHVIRDSISKGLP